MGSPSDTGGARLVWQHLAGVSSLVPLQTNDIFGLPPATSLLLSHAKDTALPLGNSASVYGMKKWSNSMNSISILKQIIIKNDLMKIELAIFVKNVATVKQTLNKISN